MLWGELVTQLAKQRGAPLYGAPLLCFDPGRTTGWALFRDANYVDGGQLKTADMESSVPLIFNSIAEHSPHAVVCEDYRVYKWKTDHHAWSELFTSNLIGMIETICIAQSIPIIKQMAHTAKSFATDINLKKWQMWVTGQKHQRDAIRHGCYFIIQGADKCQQLKNYGQEVKSSKKRVNPHNVG